MFTPRDCFEKNDFETLLGQSATELEVHWDSEHMVGLHEPLSNSKKIYTILFAEDEEAIRDLGNIVMESSGYRVISAPNGRAALNLLEADPNLQIDLLLTDIMMPGMDGRELAEIIRQRLPELPIVFCSGFAQESGFSEGLPSGAHLLCKPYKVDAMLEILRDCLQTAA